MYHSATNCYHNCNNAQLRKLSIVKCGKIKSGRMNVGTGADPELLKITRKHRKLNILVNAKNVDILKRYYSPLK